MNANDVIQLLGLEPLPEEGGFYREVYRAKGLIPQNVLKEHAGDRNFSTAIYYLITPTEFSALHKLPQDEVFHFYLGDPVQMIQIDPDGRLKTIHLGPDIENGHMLQAVVRGHTWQGTKLYAGGQWALMGTTVAPGFDFRDFIVDSRNNLIEQYPQHKDDIIAYTR